MRTEAWWVCSCGTPIYRVGKGKGQKWEQHLLLCPINERRKQTTEYVPQGMHIKQIPQGVKK